MAKTETKAWKDVDIEDSIAHKDDVRSGVPFLTLEPGKNGKFKKTYLRIMPPRADFPKDTFYLWQKVHFISANGVRRSVLCTEPDTGACRICTHANELTRNGMKSQADELYGRWRGLVNVVEVDREPRRLNNAETHEVDKPVEAGDRHALPDRPSWRTLSFDPA